MIPVYPLPCHVFRHAPFLVRIGVAEGVSKTKNAQTYH